MFDIKKSPFDLLLVAAIVLLFALIFPRITNIDFQDVTMFNVPLAIMAWIIPLLLVALWLLYLLTKRLLYSMTITRIHIFTTVSATFLIVTILYIGINPSHLTNGRHELIGKAIQILSIIFVGSQFTYLANVLLGLFSGHKVK